MNAQTAALHETLGKLRAARDCARIERLVQRLAHDDRRTPEAVVLDVVEGVIGDRWATAAQPNPEAQVTLMRWDVACELGPDPTIFGDNLFASLDTSDENLPPGSLLRVGQALCEVTPKPHRGCSKFRARSFPEALRAISLPEWRAHNLRGVHLRVRESGTVALGDEIVVVSRPKLS